MGQHNSLLFLGKGINLLDLKMLHAAVVDLKSKLQTFSLCHSHWNKNKLERFILSQIS